MFAVYPGQPNAPWAATAVEGAQAMGWNLLGNSWREHAEAVVLNRLGSKSLKKLMGNGMRLKVEAAWIL
eukprot:2474472-Lingulodinium_polyedra.AAC.1